MDGSTPDSLPISADRYFEMMECGIISPDDRVELLDGLLVAMAPSTPPHDSTIHRVQYALLRKLGLGVLVRVLSSWIAGDISVPQPDLAVVPGDADSYFDRHPAAAHLLVEVAQSSVLQDRVTKASIYARAGVPCYWIINVRDRCVEVFRDPDRFKACYNEAWRATGHDVIRIDAFPDVAFEARELLPPRKSRDSASFY
jgi:Uma2 family endonuclease